MRSKAHKASQCETCRRRFKDERPMEDHLRAKPGCIAMDSVERVCNSIPTPDSVDTLFRSPPSRLPAPPINSPNASSPPPAPTPSSPLPPTIIRRWPSSSNRYSLLLVDRPLSPCRTTKACNRSRFKASGRHTSRERCRSCPDMRAL
jgi:hypothetical protein